MPIIIGNHCKKNIVVMYDSMSHEDNICIYNDEETTQRLCEAVLLDKHTRRYLENISESVRILVR